MSNKAHEKLELDEDANPEEEFALVETLGKG